MFYVDNAVQKTAVVVTVNLGCTGQTTQQWWITVGKPLSLTELD